LERRQVPVDLNAVEVQRPLHVRLGRRHVVDGDSVGPPAELATTLDALVDRRVAELTAYQDDEWAARYASDVERIRRTEAAAIGGTAITESFARHLFKVMAYKDEYEVARLHLDPALEDRIRSDFGDGARYSILLHPPILRAMGLKRKIRLQSWWARPVLRALYAARGLRGTRLDVFGYDDVRRAKRLLIEDYRNAMTTAMAVLSPETRDTVLELAGLPDFVRGYEDIKLGTLERYRVRRAQLLEELAGERPGG
jgi:indolepyruvate ferredoxin oxidoreductase